MSGRTELHADVHRLLDRVERVRQRRAGRSAVLAETASGSLRWVVPSEVIRLRAARRCTVLATKRGDLVWTGGLGVIVAHWRRARIVRCHRSFAVNLDHVKAIEWLPSGTGRIDLADGSAVRLSRTYRAAFCDQLSRTCAG